MKIKVICFETRLKEALTMKPRLLLLILGACSILGTAIPAWAGTCPFFNLQYDSDCMVVLDSNKMLINWAGATEADEMQRGSDYVYGIPLPFDSGQIGHATTLCDPGVDCTPQTNPLFYSDQFGVLFFSNQYLLGFRSDAEAGCPTCAAGSDTFITEMAPGIYDATKYLDKGLQAAGFTAMFWSDVQNVPEPGTLVMFGTGAVGLAGILRRKLS